MVMMLDGFAHVIEDMRTSGTAQPDISCTPACATSRQAASLTGFLPKASACPWPRWKPAAQLMATLRAALASSQIYRRCDEFEFSDEQLGDRRWFLKENEEYKALRLDGKLLNIVLPPQISLKVMDTAPPSRTDLNSSWKEAKLETGLQIMVPLFIANGDIIRVDTAEKKYLGKDTSGE
jgi:hypothetical protein